MAHPTAVQSEKTRQHLRAFGRNEVGLSRCLFGRQVEYKLSTGFIYKHPQPIYELTRGEGSEAGLNFFFLTYATKSSMEEGHAAVRMKPSVTKWLRQVPEQAG